MDTDAAGANFTHHTSLMLAELRNTVFAHPPPHLLSKCLNPGTRPLWFSMPTHLVLDGLSVLWIGYNGQLELRHLLHLSVHVDLLQQAADLSSEQEQRVLLAMTLSEQRRAGRVDRRNPVLQIRLASRLKRVGRRTFPENTGVISKQFLESFLLLSKTHKSPSKEPRGTPFSQQYAAWVYIPDFTSKSLFY